MAGIVVPEEVAATLRDVLLLGPDCERLVCQALVRWFGAYSMARPMFRVSWLAS